MAPESSSHDGGPRAGAHRRWRRVRQAGGLGDEINHIHAIIENGTSAHRQVDTYAKAVSSGKDPEEALCMVVDQLIEETLIGT